MSIPVFGTGEPEHVRVVSLLPLQLLVGRAGTCLSMSIPVFGTGEPEHVRVVSLLLLCCVSAVGCL